jgi:hypothetical protein
MRRMMNLSLGAALGAIFAYFLDPKQGQGRRRRAASRMETAMDGWRHLAMKEMRRRGPRMRSGGFLGRLV